MARGPSPLVGYNTNVRHKGKLFHIQTEDSGVNHPHVITHLFADGGRIIASRKTSYTEHLGAEDIEQTVRKLMQEQHKAIFIELRDCVYDDPGEAAVKPTSKAVDVPQLTTEAEIDIDALERAAEARSATSVASIARAESPRRGAGRYQQTVPTSKSLAPKTELLADAPKGSSIFGGESLRGKSLDEVILNYLSDDVGEPER